MLAHDSFINWPCELSQETRQQLLSIATQSKSIDLLGVPPNGSEFQGVIYIHKGITSMTMLNYLFDSSYGLILGSKEWLGAVSIGGYDTSMIKADEIEPLEVTFFAQTKVEKLAETNDEIYQWLFAITKDFSKKWANQLSYLKCSSAIRTLFTLTELASYTYMESGNVPCIRATQHQIGDICSVSRSRVNETIQMYKRKGIIETSRECIHVVKYQELYDEARHYGYKPVQ